MQRRNFLKITAISSLSLATGIGFLASKRYASQRFAFQRFALQRFDLQRFALQRFEWHGVAFGADVHLVIKGDRERARASMQAVRKTIEALENHFSLYRSQSEISRLNHAGLLPNPSHEMHEILAFSREIWQASDGLFNPSVGARWHELARGQSPKAPIDFDNVQAKPDKVTLPANMRITLNGIAQGYASDHILFTLKSYGFEHVLVNMGEYRAGAGKWPLAAQGQRFVLNAHQAASTSNANALILPQGHSHIIHPDGAKAIWQEVTVIAETAARADGFSTAFILMDAKQIQQVMRKHQDIIHVFIGDKEGKVRRL